MELQSNSSFALRLRRAATAPLSALALAMAGLIANPFGAARADVITFDLESVPVTYVAPGARPGALTTLVLTELGLTMTLTRPGAAGPDQFDIVQNTGGQANKPAGWGLHSLDPFVHDTRGTRLIATFSTPVTSFRLEAGDYGGDADTIVLEAFAGVDATGALLATDTDSIPLGGTFTSTPVAILTVTSAVPFSSVAFVGGSTAFPHSMFYDNFVVETASTSGVPVPGSLYLLAAMVAGAAALVRRSRPSSG